MWQRDRQANSAEMRDLARRSSYKVSAPVGNRLTTGGGGGWGRGEPSSGSGDDTGLGESDGEPSSGEGEAGLAGSGEASGVLEGLLSPAKPANTGKNIINTGSRSTFFIVSGLQAEC